MPHDSVHFPASSVLKTAPLPRLGGHCTLGFLSAAHIDHSIGIDPADGTRVYNMHAGISDIQAGRLKGEFNQRSRKDAVACNKDDIAVQRKLLEMGYRGVDFDLGMNILYFKPSSSGVKVQLAPKLP